jgi:hypothetical protein
LETKNAGPDFCPDFSGAGTLKDFAFAPVRFYVYFTNYQKTADSPQMR